MTATQPRTSGTDADALPAGVVKTLRGFTVRRTYQPAARTGGSV